MKTTIMPTFKVLALCAGLTACGGSSDADADGDGEVTAAEAQELVERSGDQIRPEPGKYRATMTFVKADIPGAPPEMVEMMANEGSQTSEFCMTPEMAEKGFGEAMKDSQNDNCTISQFSIDGSQMDMAMSCDDPDAGQMEMTMTGTISPTGSDMRMTTKGAFGPMGDAEIEMTVKQERIGDCDS